MMDMILWKMLQTTFKQEKEEIQVDYKRKKKDEKERTTKEKRRNYNGNKYGL